MFIVLKVRNVIKYRSIWINVLCINIYVLSLHVENLCVGYASISNCIGVRILCDLTIVSGRTPFDGLDSSGRSPHDVI